MKHISMIVPRRLWNWSWQHLCFGGSKFKPQNTTIRTMFGRRESVPFGAPTWTLCNELLIPDLGETSGNLMCRVPTKLSETSSCFIWKDDWASPSPIKFNDNITCPSDSDMSVPISFTSSCKLALKASRLWALEMSRIFAGLGLPILSQSRCKSWLRVKTSKDGTSNITCKSKSSGSNMESSRHQAAPCLFEFLKGARSSSWLAVWASRTPIKKRRSFAWSLNWACKSSTLMWFWSESSMSALVAMMGASSKIELAKCWAMASAIFRIKQLQKGLSSQPTVADPCLQQ